MKFKSKVVIIFKKYTKNILALANSYSIKVGYK